MKLTLTPEASAMFRDLRAQADDAANHVCLSDMPDDEVWARWNKANGTDFPWQGDHPRYLQFVTLRNGTRGTIVHIHDATHYELEVDRDVVTISEDDIADDDDAIVAEMVEEYLRPDDGA